MSEKLKQTQQAAPLVITIPEAGRLLNMSPQSAYAAAKRGEIPTVRFGHLIRVPMRALERKLDEAK
jgi:excisionase family DNA binding protein